MSFVLTEPGFSEKDASQTSKLGYPDGWNNLAYCNNWVTNCIDWQGTATWKVVTDTGQPSDYTRRKIGEGDKVIQRADAAVKAVYYQSRTYTLYSTYTEDVTPVIGATRTKLMIYDIYELDEWRYEGAYNIGDLSGQVFIGIWETPSYEGYIGYHTRTIIQVYE